MKDPASAHTHDRDARAKGSVIAGVAFQGTYVLVQFVILAVLIREVGEERFGMWITIFSMTMWLSMLLMGMDRALLTWLGRVAFHQPQQARRVIRAALGVVILSSGLAGIAILVLGRSLPWAHRILNVSAADAVRDATPTAVAAMLVTAVSIPLLLSGFILQAYQRGATRHLLGIVSLLVGLGLVLLGVWLDWSLPWLGAMVVSPLMIGGALQWFVVWRLMPPREAGATDTTPVAGPMLATGMGLWLSDVAMILLLNSGALVVAQVEGATGVVPYGAVYRLVGPIFVCYVVIAHSFWPAFSDAAQAQDHKWIGGALKKSLALVIGLWLIGAAGCLLIGEPFIVWWLGEAARPGTALILAGLALALAIGVYHISVAALGGLGYIRVQAIVSIIMLLVYGIAVWVFASSINAIGVMLIQAAGIGLIGVINSAYLVLVRRRPTDPAV